MEQKIAKELTVRVIINRILDKIKAASMQGNFSVRLPYSEVRSNAVIEELERLGYCVGNDEGDKIINWEATKKVQNELSR